MAGQCVGHFDYFSAYLLYTRHFARLPTRTLVIPYTSCAPEVHWRQPGDGRKADYGR